MNTIDKIIHFKKQEIAKIKADVPVKKLVESPMFKKKTLSLKKFLTQNNSTGIIAEFKRKTPKKGIINDKATVTEVVNGYLNTNVAAISIATDISFLGGTMADLLEAKNINKIRPILRKDFIIDGFQIVESKAIGADAITLIASVLTSEQLKKYGQLASDLGLEVVYEINTIEDLNKIKEFENEMISVNNRNLTDFNVDIETAMNLVKELSFASVKIVEGGISSPRILSGFKEYGFQGFIISEHFMKTENPAEACKEFMDNLI